jgi:hypothetical protein
MASDHGDDPHATAPGEGASPQASGPAPARPTHRARWAVVFSLASAAGLLAWYGGEKTHRFFQPSEEASSRRFDFGALNRELKLSGTRNAALAFGLLGGCLGLAMSLTPDPAGRTLARASASGLLGLLVGAAAGVAGAYLVIPYHFEYGDPSGTDLGGSVLAHGIMWGLVGLGAGFSYGISRSRPDRLVVIRSAQGGLIGALVGTAAYELIGGLGFPLARTTDPISALASTRLLACLSIAIGAGLGVLTLQPPEAGRS